MKLVALALDEVVEQHPRRVSLGRVALVDGEDAVEARAHGERVGGEGVEVEVREGGLGEGDVGGRGGREDDFLDVGEDGRGGEEELQQQ